MGEGENLYCPPHPNIKISVENKYQTLDLYCRWAVLKHKNPEIGIFFYLPGLSSTIVREAEFIDIMGERGGGVVLFKIYIRLPKLGYWQFFVTLFMCMEK